MVSLHSAEAKSRAAFPADAPAVTCFYTQPQNFSGYSSDLSWDSLGQILLSDSNEPLSSAFSVPSTVAGCKQTREGAVCFECKRDKKRDWME